MTIHAAARVAELVADESAYARALALLPRERQVKAGSLRFAADRFRSVAVWLLLERLLAGAGIDASGRELSKNAFGKPSFADGRGPQFNLSHGGDWVLAGCRSTSRPFRSHRASFPKGGIALTSILATATLEPSWRRAR